MRPSRSRPPRRVAVEVVGDGRGAAAVTASNRARTDTGATAARARVGREMRERVEQWRPACRSARSPVAATGSGATALRRSRVTIRVDHVSSVLTKPGVRMRVEAAGVAHRCEGRDPPRGGARGRGPTCPRPELHLPAGGCRQPLGVVDRPPRGLTSPACAGSRGRTRQTTRRPSNWTRPGPAVGPRSVRPRPPGWRAWPGPRAG